MKINTTYIIQGMNLMSLTIAALLTANGKKCCLIGPTQFYFEKSNFPGFLTENTHGQYNDVLESIALDFIQYMSQDEVRQKRYFFTRERLGLMALVTHYENCKRLGVTCTLERHVGLPFAIEGAIGVEMAFELDYVAYAKKLHEYFEASGGQYIQAIPTEVTLEEGAWHVKVDDQTLIGQIRIDCTPEILETEKHCWYSMAFESEYDLPLGSFIALDAPTIEIKNDYIENKMLTTLSMSGEDDSTFDVLTSYGQKYLKPKLIKDWQSLPIVKVTVMPKVYNAAEVTPSVNLDQYKPYRSLLEATMIAVDCYRQIEKCSITFPNLV